MKHKQVFLIILATALCLAPALQAQNMILRFQGGTDQTILLSNLQKITFSNNNLVLNYVSGTTQSYGFSSLEKLFFSPYTDINTTSTISKSDILYNSIDKQIHFRNLAEGKFPVTVYRMDGKTVLKTTITNNESIDMSEFPASIYLIRINNQILKFKK
jgi:hypothetical protein